MHLEIQTSRKNPVGILRSSYRDGKKIRHKQFGRITGKTLAELKALQHAFRGESKESGFEGSVKVLQSKEHGASYALYKIGQQIGLEKKLYSRKEPWVGGAMAMIIGRILYAGSKLSLCQQYDNTSLFEVVGMESKPEVEKDCYEALDILLKRQGQIQKALAKEHLSDGCMVLYDITSSYLEGEYEDSKMVKWGYNRDGKKGVKQIVIGLICNKEGCPVAVEVFPGNTKDETTVLPKIEELKEKYQMEKVIFVGDRGMLIQCHIDRLKSKEGLHYITALTRAQMDVLVKRQVLQLELFDEHNIHEVTDPTTPEKRYCICRNPQKAKEQSQTRTRLIELTQKGLASIAKYTQATTVEKLGARVGKLLSKYKVAKFFHWSIQADPTQTRSCQHQLTWGLEQTKLTNEQALDGCYVITTSVSAEQMQTQEVVVSYKRLTWVEQAFRNLKTVQLEMRPIYHKRDDRIQAHIFVCMLAYYLQFQMKQRLQPLFKEDGKGKNRQWTLNNVLSTLKQITSNQLLINGVPITKISEPTPDQKMLLDYLKVSL